MFASDFLHEILFRGPEPWVKLTLLRQTMAVCHGAALAVANGITVQEFLSRGPAISCHVPPKHGLDVLISDFSGVSIPSRLASPPPLLKSRLMIIIASPNLVEQSTL